MLHTDACAAHGRTCCTRTHVLHTDARAARTYCIRSHMLTSTSPNSNLTSESVQLTCLPPPFQTHSEIPTKNCANALGVGRPAAPAPAPPGVVGGAEELWPVSMRWAAPSFARAPASAIWSSAVAWNLASSRSAVSFATWALPFATKMAAAVVARAEKLVAEQQRREEKAKKRTAPTANGVAYGLELPAPHAPRVDLPACIVGVCDDGKKLGKMFGHMACCGAGICKYCLGVHQAQGGKVVKKKYGGCQEMAPRARCPWCREPYVSATRGGWVPA